ncbi:MAG: TPM domain-containing protein [Pseudomonadota bacterium]
MGWRRVLAHWTTGDFALRRAFPDAAMQRIEAAIREGERLHSGEVMFAVEASLPTRALWADESARERALEAFGFLGAWDTEANNGVLIYLLLADRDVEIVADRGAARAIAPPAWATVCREMESQFRAGRYGDGAVAGVQRVHALLAAHFPPRPGDANELSNRPAVIRR